MYDVIVIGGGPGGYLAAERAGHSGLNVLLAEKNSLGGVCLNEGCIPSKTLLNSAKVYDYAKHGDDYGVTVTGAILNHKAVVNRKNKVVRSLVAGVKATLKNSRVTVVKGNAEIIDKNHIKVGDDVHECKHLIIATGSTPVIPPITGLKENLESGFVLTNREILDLTEIPERLVVIGGGVIGLEMASYFNSAGSKVTIVEMLPKIAGQTDSEISKLLMESYAEKGVEFRLNTKVTGITAGKVICDSGEIEADKVLLSIGRRPVIDGFGLENLNLVLDRGAIVTDAHCLTNVPNVYAVGDVNGKFMLAHVAYREAEVAVNHLLGKKDTMRYTAVPSVIYTNPEVAGVGETEETAKSKGIDYIVSSLPMTYSGRYIAENSKLGGMCKVLADARTRRVIGVHMIGSYASEIIVSAGIMIEMEMSVEDVKEVIFPHPCVCEIIRENIFKL